MMHWQKRLLVFLLAVFILGVLSCNRRSLSLTGSGQGGPSGNSFSCSVISQNESVNVSATSAGDILDEDPDFELTVHGKRGSSNVKTRVISAQLVGIGQLVTSLPTPSSNFHDLTYEARKVGGHTVRFLVEEEGNPSSRCDCEIEVTVNGDINQVTLTSIAITPNNPTLNITTAAPLTATGTYSDQSTANITSQVSWSSSNTAVAVVGNTTGVKGVLGATTPGTATISATLEGITGTTNVTVVDPTPVLQYIDINPKGASVIAGNPIQFIATAVYSDMSTVNVTSSVFWGSSATSKATINSAGLATGVSAGVTTISMAIGGFTNQTTLNVTAPQLSSISIAPLSPTIAINGTRQFTATGHYTNSSTSNLTSQVTWSSSNPSMATINGAGLATGVGLGSTQITASFNSFSASTSLSVDARQAYFVYTHLGDFDRSLNEIIGSGHDFDGFNFKNRRFKIYVHSRLLSRIKYKGRDSYNVEDISSDYDVDTFGEIYSVQRFCHGSTCPDRPPGSGSCTIVPDSVFGGHRLDFDVMKGTGHYLNLSGNSGPVYIFKYEGRERWATGDQGCYPSIHSGLTNQWGSVVATPTFSGCPAYCDCSGGSRIGKCDYYSNTYGNGAYVYVTNSGQLRFKYKVSRVQSGRVLFLIGILSDDLQ